MRLLTAEAQVSKGRRVGEYYIFSPVRALEGIYSIAAAMGASFLYFGMRASGQDKRVGIATGLVGLVFALTTWPKGIWTSESGVKQRSWFGRWKLICWPDVIKITEARDGSIVIRSSGTKIEFSKYHAGRELFLGEIRRHCPRVAAHLINVKPQL
jgi:hypothetical protein